MYKFIEPHIAVYVYLAIGIARSWLDCVNRAETRVDIQPPFGPYKYTVIQIAYTYSPLDHCTKYTRVNVIELNTYYTIRNCLAVCINIQHLGLAYLYLTIFALLFNDCLNMHILSYNYSKILLTLLFHRLVIWLFNSIIIFILFIYLFVYSFSLFFRAEKSAVKYFSYNLFSFPFNKFSYIFLYFE